MKAALQSCMAAGVLLAAAGTMPAQSLVDLRTQSHNADFSSFSFTRPLKTGTTLPPTCTLGDLFFQTNATAGQNVYGCTAANTWTLQAGLNDPGTNGLVQRTGASTTTTITAPSGAVVGTTDTQTLTNKSIAASEITTGTLSFSRIPAISSAALSDGSSVAHQVPVANLPSATLTSGQLYWVNDGVTATDCSTGGGVFAVPCKSNGTAWAAESLAGNFSLLDPGANGIVKRTAANTTVAVAAPAGNIVGDSDTQTLTNKSIAASEVNSGILAATLMPAWSGDVSTAAGATATTLATVNANPGSYGDATHAPQITVDAKGRITSVAQVAISGGGSGGLTAPAAGMVKSNGTTLQTAVGGTDYIRPSDSITGTAAGITSKTTPAGALVGTSDTQTLTNKSIDASEVNTGTLVGALLPALSGDVATAAGSTSTTLATVNSTPGNFGDATHAPQITVDAKGRVTSVAQVAISGGGGGVSAPAAGMVKSNGTTLQTAVGGTDYIRPSDSITGTAAGITSKATPAGALVGTTDTQTLTNKSIDASEVNTGTLASALLPAFSGDVATAAGSTSTTLATVNSTPGNFGDATHATQITVDAKGRITSVGQVAISGGGGLSAPAAGIVKTDGTSLQTAVGGTDYIRPSDSITGTAAGITSKTTPAGALVGTTDTQTLTNKNIDASEINTSTFAAARIPDLSGTYATKTAGGDLSGTLPNPTVANVNGTAFPTNSSTDQTPVTTAAATVAWKSLPSCLDSSGNHLNYNTTTHAFSCGSSSSGGGSGSSPSVYNNATLVGAQPALNFIPGSMVNLNLSNNTGANRIDITPSVDATGLTNFIQSTALSQPTLLSTALHETLANNTGTGTTQSKLVTVSGSPSTAILATAASTTPLLGLADTNAGTSGSVGIAFAGTAACAFDAATTAGHFAQKSTTVDGDCHDAGATSPSTGQIVGIVLQTIGAAGNANVILALPPFTGASSAVQVSGTQVAGTTLNYSSTTPTAPGTSPSAPLAQWQTDAGSPTTNISSYVPGVLQRPSRRHFALTGTTGTAFSSINEVSTSTGTLTHATADSTFEAAYVLADTGTAASVTAGVYGAANWRRNTTTPRNVYIETRVVLPTITAGGRFVFGLSDASVTGTMSPNDAPTGNFVEFRLSTTAADAGYQCLTNNNATATVTAPATAIGKDTNSHTLAIQINDSTATVYFFVDNLTTPVCTVTATLPNTGISMRPYALTYNTTTGTGNNRQVKLTHIYTEGSY